MTRVEYLEQLPDVGTEAANAHHRAYYAQFVDEAVRAVVLGAFGLENLRLGMNYDDQAHYIPLSFWDSLVPRLRGVDAKMRELGDYLTQAGGVCVLKEAAQQVVEAAP